MMTFIQSELIKLKHSKIFLLTVLGALTFPFLLYLSLISGTADGFESMLRTCNQFTGSMFNIVLFAIVVSYIFGREYTEHTLKTMMKSGGERAAGGRKMVRHRRKGTWPRVSCGRLAPRLEVRAVQPVPRHPIRHLRAGSV